jgi:hypothetical protein
MKATIDRIEGTIAVLIPRDDEAMRFNLPVSFLPSDSREGDILTIGIERDLEGTKEAKKRLSGRIERLKKRQ